MKGILEIIEEYGLEVTKEGEILRALCPFHEDSGRPNFTVYPKTESWFCFACNFGGSVINFVARIEHISKKEAIAKLKGDGVDMEELTEEIDALWVPMPLPPANVDLNIYVSQMCFEFLQKYPDADRAPVMAFLEEMDKALANPETDFNKYAETLKIMQAANRTFTKPV